MELRNRALTFAFFMKALNILKLTAYNCFVFLTNKKRVLLQCLIIKIENYNFQPKRLFNIYDFILFSNKTV